MAKEKKRWKKQKSEEKKEQFIEDFLKRQIDNKSRRFFKLANKNDNRFLIYYISFFISEGFWGFGVIDSFQWGFGPKSLKFNNCLLE